MINYLGFDQLRYDNDSHNVPYMALLSTQHGEITPASSAVVAPSDIQFSSFSEYSG